MNPKHLRYKFNVLAALRNAGYTPRRIRDEKIIGEQMLQKIREGEMPSWKALEFICEALGLQPGDIIEYIPESKEEQEEDDAIN